MLGRAKDGRAVQSPRADGTFGVKQEVLSVRDFIDMSRMAAESMQTQPRSFSRAPQSGAMDVGVSRSPAWAAGRGLHALVRSAGVPAAPLGRPGERLRVTDAAETG